MQDEPEEESLWARGIHLSVYPLLWEWEGCANDRHLQYQTCPAGWKAESKWKNTCFPALDLYYFCSCISHILDWPQQQTNTILTLLAAQGLRPLLSISQDVIDLMQQIIDLAQNIIQWSSLSLAGCVARAMARDAIL